MLTTQVSMLPTVVHSTSLHEETAPFFGAFSYRDFLFSACAIKHTYTIQLHEETSPFFGAFSYGVFCIQYLGCQEHVHSTFVHVKTPPLLLLTFYQAINQEY